MIELNETTAYLAGVIIGDGNVSNYVKSKKRNPFPDYRISIDISDKNYLLHLWNMFKTIVNTKAQPMKSSQKPNTIPRLTLAIRNKEMYRFFNETLEIPKGFKSSIVFMPSRIKNSDLGIKRAFLAGYFDTDGGFRGNSLGFTSGSKKMSEDICQLFNEFGIDHRSESWVYQKYNRTFYGFNIRKHEIGRFLKMLPLQNMEKLGRIRQRFPDAAVSERSNEAGLGKES